MNWMRRIGFFIFFILTFTNLRLLSPCHAKEIQTAYPCYYTSQTLQIDGMMEEAWKQAPVLAFFVPPKGETPQFKTEGRVRWNEKYLFVYSRAYDKDIKGRMTQRDSSTFKDDVLEVFFKPLAQSEYYYNFEINPLGTIYDGLNTKTMNWAERKKWNSLGTNLQIRIDGTLNDSQDQDKLWEMEIAIPWSDLTQTGSKPPVPGDTWLFHLSRYDYSVYLPQGPELSSCASLSRVNFHNWDEWIELHFKAE